MFSQTIFLKRQLVGAVFAAVLAAPVLAQNYVAEVQGIKGIGNMLYLSKLLFYK